MPFQIGNTLGQSRRVVENELRKVVHRRPERLRAALDRLLDDCVDSDSPTHRLACISFVADRLDGRARQSLDLTTDGSTRELSLSDVVAAVLAARRSDADTVQVIDSAEDSTAPALPPIISEAGGV